MRKIILLAVGFVISNFCFATENPDNYTDEERIRYASENKTIELKMENKLLEITGEKRNLVMSSDVRLKKTNGTTVTHKDKTIVFDGEGNLIEIRKRN